MTDQELGELGVLSVVNALNLEIQRYVSEQGETVPADLLRLLADLDWTVRNGYAETRASLFQQLRQEAAKPRDWREIVSRTRDDLLRKLRGPDGGPWWGDPTPTPAPESRDGEAGDGHRRWEDIKAERRESDG